MFTFISEGIQIRLGLRQDEIIGRPIIDIANDLNEPGIREFRSCFAERKPFRDLVFSVTLPGYPGATRHIRVSGEPFYIGNVYCGYRGATTDVTREIRTTLTLKQLATHDALTELPNRSAFDCNLAARLDNDRSTSQHGIFFLDLDRFKEVNDSLGHRVGDALLVEVARRLHTCMRPGDMVTRLGGDEFVILAECSQGAMSALRIAQKLLDAFLSPVIVKSQELKVSCSIGISLYPQDGNNSETLLSAADTALYRAKAQGRGMYCFFTAEMREQALMRHTLKQDMRGAAARGEFTLHYQPRVSVKYLQVVSAEALIRWQHPRLGNIPPASFISLAEENGAIREIGTWVLTEAIKQVGIWRSNGHSVKISVNLSPLQLHDPNLVRLVREALNAENVPPEVLELEITESALMEDQNLAIAVMRELKALGITLSIDDFGTGYSSLSHLRNFPLDCLKLDKTFLDLQQTAAISPLVVAESIIDLAHALNLTVVAEGVESIEHLEFLRRTSCDEIQGYIISQPVPPGDFARLFAGLWSPINNDYRTENWATDGGIHGMQQL